jgi:hypothetical protein
LSSLFAAGEVYISNIIDYLTAQAFYNPNIVTVLQQLLVGRCDSFHRDFEKYLMRHFGDKITQSNLWQILMPEEMYGKTFDKLFKFLLDKSLVTLGLYRLVGAQDNSTPYVFTNPSPKIICTAKDRVFVLGKEIPKDFIINKQEKKGINEQKQGNAQNDKDLKKSTQISLDQNQGVRSHRDFYGIRSKPNDLINTDADETHLNTGRS